MKPKVYLETSIISYLTAKPSSSLIVAGHQLTTFNWWNKERKNFNLFVSDLVLAEARRGDAIMVEARLNLAHSLKSLAITEEVIELSEKIMECGILPAKAAADASHIAIATIHRIDYLLTWNCKHIANAKIFPKVYEICENNGYKPSLICTPNELLGENDDER
ncbi:MAG: type II toxin-antitoxin system VapC family toxin [Pyrinomonadaceae bacterium]